MKLPFKYIAILVIVSLAGIFAYQAYWLTGLYHTMHSEMERDITEAMRMSDYNEMMIRVDKMKQDDINHGEVSVSAGYSDDGKSFVRSSTTISREDSLDNATLHETFMPRARTTLALVMLTLSVTGAYYWSHFQEAEENEEIDSALLSDDLPINAYLDHGFHAWLAQPSTEDSAEPLPE